MQSRVLPARHSQRNLPVLEFKLLAEPDTFV